MTDMDTLIERLRVETSPARREEILVKGWDTAVRALYDEIKRSGEHGDYPRLLFESWMLDGKDELLDEAATALQQAIAERDEALEGKAIFAARAERFEGYASEVTRLTAAFSEEAEACAKLRARIEKFESIDIPVAFTGTIGPLTREGRVAIIVLEPPVLGCRYAVVRTETRGLIDLLMQFDGLTNLVGLPVEGEGFPGPDALLAAAIRSRKDKA